MKRNKAGTALLTLAVLLAIATSSVAQTEARNPAGASNSHTETQAGREPSSSGPHEGIKVHGHWTIVVRDKDGRVVSHHEFENALVSSGTAVLVSLLSRSGSAGPWFINLNGNVCVDGNGNVVGCSISDSALSAPPITYGFPTLKVALQQPSGSGATYSLLLTGTAKATLTGAITSVDTLEAQCASNVAPAACASTPLSALTQPGFFTSHTLTAPIAVQAGQSIDVTVVVSFS